MQDSEGYTQYAKTKSDFAVSLSATHLAHWTSHVAPTLLRASISLSASSLVTSAFTMVGALSTNFFACRSQKY
jgi:hypothetical protein